MIYLDNAATSYPKPPEVTKAVVDMIENCGGNAGRGGYKTARIAAEKIYICREELADLFNINNPERIIFKKTDIMEKQFKFLAPQLNQNAL